MEYRIAVQCKDVASGKTATFIRDENKVAVSPLFRDLVELFPWMRENGWKQEEGYGENFKPWRVVHA
jgi:hypothetical protein